MTPTQPLYTDRPRRSIMQLLSPAIAAAVAVLGLVQFEPVSVAMGGGLLAYVWFTRHTRYEVFQDRMVIRYGSPRMRSVPMTEIGEVRLVNSPMGGQDLLVRRKGGGVMVIRPSDPERFAKALGEARGVSPEGQTEAQASKEPRSRPRRSRNRKA